jgi:hypothetical protein
VFVESIADGAVDEDEKDGNYNQNNCANCESHPMVRDEWD